MATLDELSRALIAADKAGDAQAARILAKEIRRVRAPIADNLNAETLNPTTGMSFFDKAAAGVGKAIVDTGRGLGQMVGLVSRDDVAESRKRDAALMDTGAGIAGNIGGNVAMALTPGMAAKGLSMVPALARAAPALNAAGNALMAPRTIGGAAALGAGMGLVQPSTSTGETLGNMALGGVASAAVPTVIRGLQSARAAAEPFYQAGQDRILGRLLQKVAGGDAPAVASRLRESSAPFVGPALPGEARAVMGEIVPGSVPTLGQAAGNPGIASLERALNAASPEAQVAIAKRILEQQEARRAALSRIAPTAGSTPEAREAFGAVYDRVIPSLEKGATARTRAAFEGVDPFGEVKIELPIDAMKAAQAKFLGEGTFGNGGKAAQALAEAERIGTDTIKAVSPKAAQGHTLSQAVRKMGGIKADGTGELASLTNRGSGSSGLVQRGGVPSDLMAEEMARRGFIKSADPDELVQALEGGLRGRVSLGNEASDAVYEAMRALSQGGGGGQIPKALPFQTIQNFRSSLGEAAQAAKLAGNKQEAAALRQMQTEIENKIAAVADGGGSIGEAFGADQVLRWREALKSHADKMQRFHTGPQAAGFRTGSDGLPRATGAELAPRFFNSSPGQAQDIQSFMRVAGDQSDVVKALKSYALTDAERNLTPAAFREWKQARASALKGLLTPQEAAKVETIAADLARAQSAQNLGKGVGSDTIQKLAYSNMVDAAGVPSWLRNMTGMQVMGNLAGRGADAVYGRANREMASRLADAAIDPGTIARLLTIATETPRAPYSDILTKLLAPGALALPGIVNTQKQ